MTELNQNHRQMWYLKLLRSGLKKIRYHKLRTIPKAIKE